MTFLEKQEGECHILMCKVSSFVAGLDIGAESRKKILDYYDFYGNQRQLLGTAKWIDYLERIN